MKYFFAILLSVITFASCVEYNPIEMSDAEMDYNRQFRADFGKPAAGHDFGFIDQPIIDATSVTRTVNCNANDWYRTLQLNVPGYPDADGYFHGTKTTDSDGYLTSNKVNISDVPANLQGTEKYNWISNYAGNPVGDVTTEEAEYVMNWFKTHQITSTTSVHWSEFFVMYIGYDGAGAIKAGGMDELGYRDIEGNWEHVNDFNGKTKSIKYVSNAGTEAWSYKASHSGKTQFDKYTMQYLRFTVNGHEYEGWYLGFDYESIKGDQNDVAADGYYCDWVLKICPGTHLGYPLTVRVMCEDLGHSFDWDFNDVVFDVSFSNEYVNTLGKNCVFATIVVEAAGGTMPIYIGTIDEKYEVHKLLGDGSMTPIVRPKAFSVYKINLTELNIPYVVSEDNRINAKNIPIYVQGEQAVYTINEGVTPQKFACPDNVDWTEECQNICDKYPNVPQWVTSMGFEDVNDVWSLNPHPSR